MAKYTPSDLLKMSEKTSPISKVAHRALEITSDPEADLNELANVIATDNVMTSTLLRWVNSAYYGIPRSIATVGEAIVRLGVNQVRNLVLTSAFGGIFMRELPIYGLDRGDLWKHSVGVAAGSFIIAKKYGAQFASHAYHAGLLCDLGKLTYETAFRKEKLLSQGIIHKDLSEIEDEYFGMNHSEMGALVAEKWNFPEIILESIAHHHAPEKSETQQGMIMASIVNVADVTMNIEGVGIGREKNLTKEYDTLALSLIGWDASEYKNLIEEVTPYLIEAEHILADKLKTDVVPEK